MFFSNGFFFLVYRYYKKFDIPDLCRVNIGLEANNLKFTHKNNTLVITVIDSFYWYWKEFGFLKLIFLKVRKTERISQAGKAHSVRAEQEQG